MRHSAIEGFFMLNSHVIRIAIVAAVAPSSTSLMKSSRLCILVPVLSHGTSFGKTAWRNFRSLAVPCTVFATWSPVPKHELAA